MAWIESHTVLLRHRKVLMLSTDLNLSPVAIVGHLHVLWHAILEQQEDGDLRDWPDEMIAQAASYDGDAASFVSALQSRKWLDGKLVHDWLEYAGRYLQSKYKTSNPSKLEKIYRKHQTASKSVSRRSKVCLKSPHLTKPNQPDLTRPNPDNLPSISDGVGVSDFDLFWDAFPKKIGKKAALKAWDAAKDKPAIDAILAAIERAKQSAQWTKDGGQFIPHPATWLNQGRWADVPTVVTARPDPNGVLAGMQAFLDRRKA